MEQDKQQEYMSTGVDVVQEAQPDKAVPLNVPTFNSAFSSKVYVESFDELDYAVDLMMDMKKDRDLENHLAILKDADKYKDEVLADSQGTASAALKFKALKVNEQMIEDINKKLEGYTKQATQSYQTQQITEMQKQSAFIYFQTFSQVAGPEDLLAFAEVNKDSIELLSLVSLKLSQVRGDYSMQKAKAQVQKLLEEAQAIPEKQKLMEVRKLLEDNRNHIKQDGLMYLPQTREFININKMLRGELPGK